MTKPVLFYSKNDRDSINLWNSLSQSNYLDHFIKICVDNNPKIPKMITSVPTIYIKNRPLLTGSSIPLYLNSLKSTIGNSQQSSPNRGLPQNQPTSSRNPGLQNNTSAEKPENSSTLNDFNPVEMSNRWSDSYSFIDNNSEPQSFSFQFLNKDSLPNTPNNDQPVPVKQEFQPKGRNNDFQNRLEKMQQERSNFT